MLTKEQEAEKKKQEFLKNVDTRIAEGVSLAMAPIEELVKELQASMDVKNSEERNHDLPGSDEATHNGEEFMLTKVVNAVSMTNNPDEYEKYAPLEWEMSKELAKRDANHQAYASQGTNDDGLGGFMIPTQIIRSTMLEIIQSSLITHKLGVTEMFDLVGRPTILPRMVDEPAAEAVAEGQGSGDETFETGMFKLEPHAVQVYMKAARTFLKYATPDGEKLMRKLMGKAVARKYNDFALTGTGGSGQPRGLLNQGGLQTQSWGTTFPNHAAAYNLLLQMEGKLKDASVLEEGDATLKWLCSPAFIRGLRQMKSENRVLGTTPGTNENLEFDRKVFSSAAAQKVLGYDYVETSRMISLPLTDSDLILGDFERMIFGMWGSMVIEGSNVAADAMRRRETHFVAHTEVDFGVTHPEAFCAATSLNLTGM